MRNMSNTNSDNSFVDSEKVQFISKLKHAPKTAQPGDHLLLNITGRLLCQSMTRDKRGNVLGYFDRLILVNCMARLGHTRQLKLALHLADGQRCIKSIHA